MSRFSEQEVQALNALASKMGRDRDDSPAAHTGGEPGMFCAAALVCCHSCPHRRGTRACHLGRGVVHGYSRPVLTCDQSATRQRIRSARSVSWLVRGTWGLEPGLYDHVPRLRFGWSAPWQATSTRGGVVPPARVRRGTDRADPLLRHGGVGDGMHAY